MLWVLVLICVTSCAWSNAENVESLLVNTQQGSVRGYKSPDGDFYLFYGVPYATAPTGSQRFQAPLPPPVRLETFEAVDKYVVCPQFNYYGIIHNGINDVKENCLIANLYVPDTAQKNLPVLVYIHGGAFALGFGEYIKHKHLAKSKKAIIVNFNYRLGVQGFLCLGTNDAPGNAGMKDQVALLRWVKDNIAGFGGNPDDITIAGYSAGSISADLLVLSKIANGLFHKVIPESGASTATFAVQLDPIESAKKYAKMLNFSNTEDISALEEFYKTASYDLLTSIDLTASITEPLLFTPCIEQDIGVERFLDDSPVNIFKSGDYQKRPMMYGFSKMEGLTRLDAFDVAKDMMNEKFSDFLPADLQFDTEDEKEKISAQVKNFYFGTKPVNEDTILQYVDYFSDIMFVYTTVLSLKLQVEAGNNEIYLYEYVYADESSTLIPYNGNYGAYHCAQTWAVLDGLNFTHRDESIASDGYKNMKKVLREIWLNFVTTGKPVPEDSSLPWWPTAGADGSPYMVLDQDLELIESPILEKRMQLWHEIYSKYYRYPAPPNTPLSPKTEF